jgi:hypothetical protein
VVDMPIQTISFAFNGRRKELKEGCGCPAELVKLEQEIDETSGTRRWVRGRLRVMLHWPWIHL